jgi:hypothetical protein
MNSMAGTYSQYIPDIRAPIHSSRGHLSATDSIVIDYVSCMERFSVSKKSVRIYRQSQRPVFYLGSATACVKMQY